MWKEKFTPFPVKLLEPQMLDTGRGRRERDQAGYLFQCFWDTSPKQKLQYWSGERSISPAWKFGLIVTKGFKERLKNQAVDLWFCWVADGLSTDNSLNYSVSVFF